QVSLVPEGRDGVAEFLPSRRLGAHGSRLPKMVLLGLRGAVPGDARSGPPGLRSLDAEPPALSCSGGSATPPERHPGGPCVIPSRTPLPTPFDRSTFRSLARLAPARRPPQAEEHTSELPSRAKLVCRRLPAN